MVHVGWTTLGLFNLSWLLSEFQFFRKKKNGDVSHPARSPRSGSTEAFLEVEIVHVFRNIGGLSGCKIGSSLDCGIGVAGVLMPWFTCPRPTMKFKDDPTRSRSRTLTPPVQDLPSGLQNPKASNPSAKGQRGSPQTAQNPTRPHVAVTTCLEILDLLKDVK